MALLRLLNGRYQTKVFRIISNIIYVAQIYATEGFLAIYLCKRNKGVLTLNSWCFKNIRQWIIPFCYRVFFIFWNVTNVLCVSNLPAWSLCNTAAFFEMNVALIAS